MKQANFNWKQLILIFFTNPFTFCIAQRFGQRLQPIYQINKLPEDGLKSLPETSRYTENKWISWKNKNKLYFLHLIDILNDLLLINWKQTWKMFTVIWNYLYPSPLFIGNQMETTSLMQISTPSCYNREESFI